MLQALFHKKLGHAIQDGSFHVIEDTLTSSVIGTLQYLPDGLFWQLLRGCCGASAGSLPESIGPILGVHFWEHLDARGTYNAVLVEPDVWIETDRYDIIIEAKRSDSAMENAQSSRQWFNEITALQNLREEEDGRELLFIAIGGNEALKDREIETTGGERTVIPTGSWFDLLGEILKLREECGQGAFAGDGVARLLDDVVTALQFHGIIHVVWLGTLPGTRIGPEAGPFISERWRVGRKGFLGPLADEHQTIGIESLSGIWETRQKT